MMGERLKKLEAELNAKERAAFDMERELEDLHDEIFRIETEIDRLKAMTYLSIGQAFEFDGLMGVVLYHKAELVRVVMRWWDGRFIEEWLDPNNVGQYRPLPFNDSCSVFNEFRAMGVV